MVKQLDDIRLEEHVGLDLWRAAIAWRKRLHDEMVQRGHAWYGDARNAIATYLEPHGMSQADLVRRMGMTKQAVQQLLDGLEADGIIMRQPDPDDGRGKRIVYTERGLAAVRDAVRIKKAIERDYRAQLGDDAFRILRSSLRALAPSPEET